MNTGDNKAYKYYGEKSQRRHEEKQQNEPFPIKKERRAKNDGRYGNCNGERSKRQQRNHDGEQTAAGNFGIEHRLGIHRRE